MCSPVLYSDIIYSYKNSVMIYKLRKGYFILQHARKITFANHLLQKYG